MAKFPPDERTVYLAFKNVFKGPDGNTRSEKKIKKKIQKHENQSDEIRALVHEHNIDNVGNSVKALLEGDVFASTLKAKMRFPELFDVSPAQSAERAASEAEAVRTEMDAMRDANVTHQDQSVLQSAERAASEITAVKTEIDANRDVSVTQQKHNLPTVVDGEAVVKKEQPHIHGRVFHISLTRFPV
jgi:carbonic anhydrase